MSQGAPVTLPRAVRPFTDFARVLRDHGFPVTTDQTAAFLAAIPLLGPRGIGDIYWAARATLAPDPDRTGEFDALFNAAFREDYGTIPSARSLGGEESTVADSGTGTLDPVAAETATESGAEASGAEALALKSFPPRGDSARLRALRRQIATAAPRRRGYRTAPVRAGDRLDLRRSLARMVRGGAGDSAPAWVARRHEPRRILILIDISGSMKGHTDDHLRFAHTLTRALPGTVETFSFGTRLTHLTRSMRHRDAARMFAEVAPAVADWDGGTRIADSIAAYLAVPRFSRASRGALVLVLSDGLERGDASAMAQAVRRLAARSWRLAWLTPLAADPAFRPATEALSAILPIVDHLGDGSGLGPLCTFMEKSAALGKRAPARGRMGGMDYGSAGHRRTPSHLAAG